VLKPEYLVNINFQE